MEIHRSLAEARHPTPRLSIIIATWNAARTLERCLDSLFSQSFARWELLVADAASTDGTTDIIRKNTDRIAWWRSEKDRGIYDAWNHALVHATGDYVTFLGADDALHSEDVLERMFAAIGSTQYDLVSSRCLLRDADWHPLGEAGKPWNHARLPRRMGITHPGLLHRRELFALYGEFDASLRIVGDLEFLLRLPDDIRTLHIPFVSIDVQNDGVSRKQFWCRLRERRLVHARCARVGRFRADLYWLDKAWRMPIARLLGLQH
ncbi:glycosyltransferase family 2 protein [Cognatiluteimonas profundi]|uniref:glycosyltransferase family 2 protein n=1 Tax=Cognatiluteimonas profundi TaxID=2594501 RepID=UPI00131B8438|nr:glycosyltransferase family 2 protein [Lysobacter profundi]